jgi:hypothetical protein
MQTLAMTTNRILRYNDLNDTIEELHAGSWFRKRLTTKAELTAGGVSVEDFTRAWMEDHGIQANDCVARVGQEQSSGEEDGTTSDAQTQEVLVAILPAMRNDRAQERSEPRRIEETVHGVGGRVDAD